MTRAHIDTPRLLPRARALKLVLVAAAVSAACGGNAYAEPARAGSRAIQPVHESPYSIDLLAPDGRTLPTYEHRGRFYVLGEAGDRYTVRVNNPTSRRVEAVISIDGLDAIDGETADYRTKRGYIVPARGEVRIDGFRVSERAVAAFRFSSVADSYAGRKGMARNVGVIGIAIFEERAGRDEIVYGRPYRERRHRRYRSQKGHGRDADAPAERSRSGERGPSAADAPAAGSRAPSAESEARTAPRSAQRDAYRPCCDEPAPESRPGLGTEFGENRYAPVTWTRFERANPRRPTAIAELRYNDADGLMALGIDLGPRPYDDDLWLRETASPFPFARPPGHR